MECNVVQFRFFLALVMFVAVAAIHAGEPAPLEGETKLEAAEVDRALSDLPAFKNPQPLKAKMVAETEDFVGTRKEEGELLLSPPSQILRTFTKPKPKTWLLNGTLLQVYIPARKQLYVTDFSDAPKTLKRIQNAFTGDLKSLRELFAISVFSSAGGKAYRFVLVPAKGESAVGYKRIQAKLAADALFFHEITYEPDSGDKVTEKYSAIEAVAKPAASAFELNVPDDVTRKTDKVSDTQ